MAFSRNVNYPSFQAVRGALKGRVGRKLENNTYLLDRGDEVVLTLHGHEIIRFSESRVEYDSCGYRSNTTKKRLNDYGPTRVYQKDYRWYVGQGELFVDGMAFDYQGLPLERTEA